MKAMVLKEFGGVENFAITEIPQPQINENEVLIKVHAIGINPVDIKTRKGSGMAAQFRGHHPIVLGWDVSGTITQAGKNVKDFIAGDEVFGTINFPGAGKAYSEYVAAPASQLAKKPSNISHAEAAASTLAALTAWQALVNTGNIKKGDKVLIHGATGGVGNFATQIAKYFDTYIVGTTSETGLQFAKELGADEVIDYRNQRFEEISGNFDLILDTVGGENFIRSLKVLKPDGTIILLPSDKSGEAQIEADKRHVKNYHHILMHSSGKDMDKIASMLKTGRMHAFVDKTFPFEQLPEAHTALENGKVKGKVVVTLSH